MNHHRPLTSFLAALPLALCGAGALSACLPNTERPATPPPEVLAPPAPPPPTEEEVLFVDDSAAQPSASQVFNLLLLPLIKPVCAGCHGGRSGDLGPPFMASSSPDRYDPYTTMKGWKNFLPDNPELSLLLTRGPHEGPALDLDQAAAVLRWVTREKVERDLQVKPAARPQTRPFYPILGGTLNTIPMKQIDAKLDGASIQFTARVTPGVRGVSLGDLRIVNKLPGAMVGDQRTIRIARPIFIVWSGPTAEPDVGDSLGGLDRSIKLDEDDKPAPAGPGGPGLLLAPLLTLPHFDVGDALSIAFNIASVVGVVVSPNTCRPAGLTLFGTQIKEYLGKANACAKSGCHNATNRIGGLNFEPLGAFTGTDYTPLAEFCEQMKYYRNLGVLERNTNPVIPAGNGHRYRWGVYTYNGGGNGCTENGFAADCFTTFKARLDAWTQLDQ